MLSTPADVVVLIIFAVSLLVAAFWLGKRLGSSSVSLEEIALRALDQAAAQVAKIKDPSPEQLAAISAAETRKIALSRSIQASMAKINGLPPAST